MEEVGEKKREMINEVIKRLNGFSDEELEQKRKIIEDKLFEFANFMEAKVALLYMTRGCEVDTKEIIGRTLGLKKIVALPSFDTENNSTTLMKVENLEGDLIYSANNMPVPDPVKCKVVPADKIDIAIIPGVVFDEKGGRIGLGDSFYDKFIPKLPITTRKVAIAFEEQVMTQIPVDSRNKNIDIVITDKRIIYKI